MVRGYLLRRIHDPHLAEDLAQETFVKATRALLGWRGESPVAWLLSIARTLNATGLARVLSPRQAVAALALILTSARACSAARHTRTNARSGGTQASAPRSGGT